MTNEENASLKSDLVATLSDNPAFKRRWLRLEEVPEHARYWVSQTPTEPSVAASSDLFVHSEDSLAEPLASFQALDDESVDPLKMSFKQFMHEIAPGAESIQLKVPAHQVFYGSLTTAVYPDAAVILKHDSLDNRNPVSWYTLDEAQGNSWSRGGTRPEVWQLAPGSLVPVSMIITNPEGWNTDNYHNTWFLLVLEGARSPKLVGLALPIQHVRDEFKTLPSIIEATETIVREGQLEGHESSFAGITVNFESAVLWLKFFVKKNGGINCYLIELGS